MIYVSVYNLFQAGVNMRKSAGKISLIELKIQIITQTFIKYFE